jgi:hypothetical protein
MRGGSEHFCAGYCGLTPAASAIRPKDHSPEIKMASRRCASVLALSDKTITSERGRALQQPAAGKVLARQRVGDGADKATGE